MKTRIALVTCAIVLGGLRSAEATAISYTDTFQPTSVFFDRSSGACTGQNGAADTVSGGTAGKCESLTFTMSLFPDFDPATDTLTAGSLTLSFHDDGDPSSDKFNYVLDLLSGDGTVTSGSGPFVWTLGVLSELADGTVVVKLDTKTGDFYFDKAVLSASGDRVIVVSTDETPNTAVPEPASMALLGVGLLVAGARARRRRV